MHGQQNVKICKYKGLPVTCHVGKRKSRDISLFILNLCARLGGHHHVPVVLPRRRTPVPFLREAGWVGLGRDRENLCLTRFQTPDRPARSESL